MSEVLTQRNLEEFENIANDKIMNFDDFSKEVFQLLREICSSS